MQELLPGRETGLAFSRRGDAGSDRATGLANPVLNLTKTAGRSWVPLDTVSSRISYNRQQ